MKVKTNRKARRALDMAHWESNRFKIALSSSATGETWAVVKKKKITPLFQAGYQQYNFNFLVALLNKSNF